MKSFEIISINVSTEKGTRKNPVTTARLSPDLGIEGDAHAGDWHRQVSLLGDEDIDEMRGKGVELDSGIFAENITTRGIPLSSLPTGSRLIIDDTELEITQIGKECHHGCEIRRQVGDCVMPRKGVFARVVRGGIISRDSKCYYNI